jgi:hypothetical protein
LIGTKNFLPGLDRDRDQKKVVLQIPSHKAFYCNRECQKAHWKGESGREAHKKFCKLYDIYEKMNKRLKNELDHNRMWLEDFASESEEEGCVTDAYLLEQIFKRHMDSIPVNGFSINLEDSNGETNDELITGI